MKKSFAALTVAVLLAACGKSSEKTVTVRDPETGKKVDVSVNMANPENVTMKTEDGTLVIGSGASAKLPAGMEIYPGASVETSMVGSGKQGSGGMVSMKTKDAPEKVLAYYKQKLNDKGMKITMETRMPHGGMLVADGDKNEAPGAMVTVSNESGDTIVSVIMGGR